jgi:hypothetical protein
MAKKRKSAFGPEAFNYTLNNPKKYTGKLPVICRSGLEKGAIWKMDNNPSIKSWGSESVVIKYFDPVKNKVRRYFMDLNFIVIDAKTKREKQFLVEVKPAGQCVRPIRGKKQEKTFINESLTYATNIAKWRATRKLCDVKGWEFLLWTENGVSPFREEL